ncbi:MAG TPA: chorismate synthase, partial [Candidatus Poseidoniales archaeon]|nr:chorismate synthase [Candidatus Poseidoniales archaeon]
MGMGLGDSVRVTLFGESHGAAVGALLEGLPAGTPIDVDALVADLERRRPGRRLLSTRAEPDDCEILSGVFEGRATDRGTDAEDLEMRWSSSLDGLLLETTGDSEGVSTFTT